MQYGGGGLRSSPAPPIEVGARRPARRWAEPVILRESSARGTAGRPRPLATLDRQASQSMEERRRAVDMGPCSDRDRARAASGTPFAPTGSPVIFTNPCR